VKKVHPASQTLLASLFLLLAPDKRLLYAQSKLQRNLEKTPQVDQALKEGSWQHFVFSNFFFVGFSWE